MLVAFLIMLREGVEAALIVGIIAGYLRQTGRSEWMPYVWAGVGLALGICILLGSVLTLTNSEFPQREQELFAGTVAIVAAAMLTSMVLWMKRASRSMRRVLHGSIDSALRPGSAQKRALIATAFFATGREGVETVFFLLATLQQDVGVGVPIGALLGLLVAVAIGTAFAVGSVRLNLRVFFRWTGVLIVFVAAGLLASSLRSFHDAGLWNGLQATAFDMTETLPSDSIVGTLLSSVFGYQDAPSLGEVLIYVAYLIPALALFLASTGDRRPQCTSRLGMIVMSRVSASRSLLVIATCLMGSSAAHSDEIAIVSLQVGDKGCEPMRVSARPGKTTFEVKNVSARKIEWEILTGVNVVEERENIIPGFTVRVTARLEAGEYLMTCGLLNNPKGSLSVAAEKERHDTGCGPAPEGAVWHMPMEAFAKGGMPHCSGLKDT